MSRTSTWTPARWASSCPDGSVRADVVYALVQRLADLGADAEGRPRRAVPRLEHPTSLPDQLVVVTADLLAAGSTDLLATAANTVGLLARDL